MTLTKTTSQGVESLTPTEESEVLAKWAGYDSAEEINRRHNAALDAEVYAHVQESLVEMFDWIAQQPSAPQEIKNQAAKVKASRDNRR